MFEAAIPVVLSLMVLAGIVEAVLEYLFVPFLKKIVKIKWARSAITRWLGGAVGAVICVVFRINLLTVVLETLKVTPAYPIVAMWLGTILTGLLSARGANWLHDFGSEFLGLDLGGKPSPRPTESWGEVSVSQGQ